MFNHKSMEKTGKIQILQSISILIQNTKELVNIYLLLSNHVINKLILSNIDFADEEIVD